MLILDASGAPYFNAIDLSRAFSGRWFKCAGGPQTLTLSGELDVVGGGNISGELSVDFTADPQELKGVAPLTMPDGCVHTALAGVALSSGKVVLTSVLAGAFGLTLAFPVAGSMRFGWKPTSIAGLTGLSRFTAHAQVSS